MNEIVILIIAGVVIGLQHMAHRDLDGRYQRSQALLHLLGES